MTVTQDQFSPAFSTAFDPPAGPANEFTAAFSTAFDPPVTSSPVEFVLTGDGLSAVGNVLDSPAPEYLLHLVEPDGVSFAINTITSSTRTRLECTWTFARPGTHYWVIADAEGAEVSARLPVVVAT